MPAGKEWCLFYTVDVDGTLVDRACAVGEALAGAVADEEDHEARRLAPVVDEHQPEAAIGVGRAAGRAALAGDEDRRRRRLPDGGDVVDAPSVHRLVDFRIGQLLRMDLEIGEVDFCAASFTGKTDRYVEPA